MLKARVDAALDTGNAKPSSLERITVDTTVQPKAMAYPTDERLYLQAILSLVRQFGYPLFPLHSFQGDLHLELRACCLRFDIFNLPVIRDQQTANRSLRQCPSFGGTPVS